MHLIQFKDPAVVSSTRNRSGEEKITGVSFQQRQRGIGDYFRQGLLPLNPLCVS